ncbi:F0F1 ATP synthase subunit B' [Alkalicaulis satelles]|uniref:ATP synthase subunit b n=1 Tax=Alkalicaulis satelles TaxID=2609175 RepID=A0A5M6ZNH0_9PROT|nr:F0F1 ATP synthase subunit B' [Alkalicaulis satelles]KAA5805247.1 F0F1 ATP synthase subunit B' [Alkalicaulis satelles]
MLAQDTAIETDAYAGGDAFPPLDPTYFASQLFWLAISFAVLYFLLSRFILPRIGGAIEERRDRIADDLDAASQMRDQADETVKAYEKSLADARARAQSVAASAKAEADADIAEAVREADARLDAQQAESEARIRAARDKALKEVRKIAAGAAADITTRLAGLDVAQADAEKAVDAARKG